MKMTKGTDAIYMRAWLSELAPEERFAASEVGTAMADRFPNVSYRGTLKSRWQLLLHRGLVMSKQSDGRKWEYWLTEDGEEFWKWMMNTEEGRAWGKADRKVKKKREGGEEGDYSKPYFQGGLVNTNLPTEPIVMDNVPANKHGLLLAYVPAGVEIIWVEEIEQEDGSVKKKPHKIKRKSDEPELSPEEKRIKELKAELAALGVEDI